MCLMLYIAADHELPLVSRFNNSHLCVEPVPPSVVDAFSKQHVYYVGSYQGCGCGFSYDDNALNSADMPPELIATATEDHQNRRKSVAALIQYLNENIALTKEIELYPCWAGDEGSSPERVTALKISEFVAGSSFTLNEKHMYLFVCDKS